MKDFLKKIFLYAGLVLLTAVLHDIVLTGIFRKGRTVKAQWLNNMHGEHYDLAIIGSSRAWWNIDANLIHRECGIRAINMANNHFTPSEILLSLKFFLENGNTIGRILMQVDYQSMSARQNTFSSTVYDYLPWLEEEIVYDHLRSRSNEWFLLRHVPYARYGRYNFLWGPEEALITLLDKRRTIFDSTGSFFMDRAYKGWPYLELGGKDFAPQQDLLEIVALCEAHNIELEMFVAPYYNLRLEDGAADNFRSVMHRHGFTYQDFSHRLDSTVHFDDNWHLSKRGGELFTMMLVKEMICPGHGDKKEPPVDVP